MPTPVASLLRLSTARQARKQSGSTKGDLDIPSQRQTIATFLTGRPEWHLVREFVETAVSAFATAADDRDILQDVLSAAAAGQFKVLIVWKQDRLSRKSFEYPMILNLLRKYGVEVWSVEEGKPLALDSQTDKIVRFLEGWQAETESVNTSIRVRERMRQLAAAGRWTGGKTPFGYLREMVRDGSGAPILVDGRPKYEIIPHPDQAPVVREMFRRYLAGQGYKAIAMWLNESGIRTTSGAFWTMDTVRGIITSPFYAGMVSYGKSRVILGTKAREKGEPILAPGQHQALVDLDTWEQTNRLREARATIPKRQRSSVFPLAGVVKCGVCGATLYQWIKYCNPGERPSTEYRMYRCTTRKVRKGCEFTGVNAQTVEDGFITALEEQFAAPTALRTFLEQQAQAAGESAKAVQVARRRMQERLIEIETALKNLTRAYLEAGTFSDREYAEQKAEYQEERQRLEAELAKPAATTEARDVGELVELVKRLRTLWNSPVITQEERKVIALRIVKNWRLKVLVYPDKRVEIVPE